MYDGLVADQDSILVGVLLKGAAPGGAGVLTVTLAAPGLTPPAPAVHNIDISTVIPDVSH